VEAGEGDVVFIHNAADFEPFGSHRCPGSRGRRKRGGGQPHRANASHQCAVRPVSDRRACGGALA
jgi:hypothetical protein